MPNGLPLYGNENLLNFKKPWITGAGSGHLATLAYNSGTGDLFIPRLDFKRLTGGGAVDNFILQALIEDFTGDTNIETLSTSGWDIQPLNTTYEALIRTQGSVTLTQPLSEETPYRFLIQSVADTYWSETFYVSEASADDDTIPAKCSDGGEWVKMYWNTDTILSNTWHSEGGIYSMNLPISIAQPQYKTNINAENNSGLTQNIKYMDVRKRFQFFLVCPEYLVDIFNALPLFQDVNLQWPDGSQMDIRELEVDTAWESNEAAKVTVSFTGLDAYAFQRLLCISV